MINERVREELSILGSDEVVERINTYNLIIPGSGERIFETKFGNLSRTFVKLHGGENFHRDGGNANQKIARARGSMIIDGVEARFMSKKGKRKKKQKGPEMQGS